MQDVEQPDSEEVYVLKIRIKFAKTGSMKFIGHLDVMRYFQKAMRRAEVDIAYSEGFSPHQKMSFAQPLGVGLTSSGEYFDIEANSTQSSQEMIKRLNAVMVEGMEVLDYKRLPDDSKNAMASIYAADYNVVFREKYKPDIDIKTEFEKFMSQDTITIVKKTKKSEREIDIKEFILDYKVDQEVIFLKTNASSGNNLKPDLVMKAFVEYEGIEYNKFMIMLERLDLYGYENEKFISLNDYGETIH